MDMSIILKDSAFVCRFGESAVELSYLWLWVAGYCLVAYIAAVPTIRWLYNNGRPIEKDIDYLWVTGAFVISPVMLFFALFVMFGILITGLLLISFGIPVVGSMMFGKFLATGNGNLNWSRCWSDFWT